MNHSVQPEGGAIKTETNDQGLLTAFAGASFKNEDAAGALGITVSGAYKLLQRMTERGLLVARKQGRQWVYGEPPRPLNSRE